MQKRYDKAISSYFVFFRFLFLVSMVFAAVYGYLIVKHIVITTNFSQTCLYSIVPCFLLYNSFTSDEQLAFVITLIVFTGLGIFLTLTQLIANDRLRRVQAYLMQDGSKRFSKALFSTPDWTLTKLGQKTDSKISIPLLLQNMLKEEQVKETIKNRSRAKKLELYISRSILFSLNFCLVVSSWVGIYYVNVYQQSISDYLKTKFSWLTYVAAFIPSVCLTLINGLIPLVTNMIIFLERWDYASSVINNQIWRNFLAKEFNIIIFFLINVDMIVP